MHKREIIVLTNSCKECKIYMNYLSNVDSRVKVKLGLGWLNVSSFLSLHHHVHQRGMYLCFLPFPSANTFIRPPSVATFADSDIEYCARLALSFCFLDLDVFFCHFVSQVWA